MAGIVSFGAYIPRRRLVRMSIMKSMGWMAPGLFSAAQGERSMANWDEDALTMAVAASRNALADMDRGKLSAVFLATTSAPFADRLNAGVLAAALNLPESVSSSDVTGAQKAGATALVQALLNVEAEGGRALVAATDKRRTKAAWFHEMWFGDGAAALLVGNDDVIARHLASFSLTRDFVDHYRGRDEKFDYNWEERWIRDLGYMKILPEAIAGALAKAGMKIGDLTRLIFPCYLGRSHGDIAKKIGAEPGQVADNMHKETGECGAAHPLIMLARELETAKPGDRLLVAGFGQGSDAAIFEVTDKIKDLRPRRSVSYHLARRREEPSYTRYLKFNELIETEMGIRAEAPRQTALTALFRRRKLILGLVGGRCKACGTPQIPSERVCVNPACGQVDSQEEYEFADQPAKILTFTGDMLAVSVDPPAIYGMVEFEAGGRLLMDFTDCELSEVEVGVPVELSFRRKYYDPQRGFTGYFWKAVPEVAAKAREGA